MKRVMLCASAALVALVSIAGSAISEEKAAKITKDQLAGEWNHSPGVRQAFLLRADGSGIMRGIHNGNVACNWDFNEHYQALVLVTRQLKRQYKAKMEDGKILFYDGRDVWFKGSNMNTLLVSPLDKAVKAEGAAEKEAEKPAEKPAEKTEAP